MGKKSIDKKYADLSASSRKARFATTAVMEPAISGVRRSLVIPPYARKSSVLIKAYSYKVSDAHQLSIDSRGHK